MNPFAFARRRPITMFLLALGLASGGILAAEEMGVDVVPGLDAAGIDSWFDGVGSDVPALDAAGIGSWLDSLTSMAMATEPEESAHERSIARSW